MERGGKHDQKQNESNRGYAQVEGGIRHIFDDKAHVAETLHRLTMDAFPGRG